MKALARYQIILLGEQRHIMCEQLAQGCCPNNAAVGVEPATSRSGVQRPTAALPSHLTRWITLQTCDLMDWALDCHYFTNRTRRMCKLVRNWVSDRSCTLWTRGHTILRRQMNHDCMTLSGRVICSLSTMILLVGSSDLWKPSPI